MEEVKKTRDEQGKLLPGHEGLRKPGTTNKLTVEVKTKIVEFIKGKIDSLEETYSAVSNKEKLRFIGELLPYVIPKQRELKIEDSTPGGFGNAKIDYTKLPPEVLKQILDATTINPEDGTDNEHIITGMTIK
jgi:hypothetical protein